VIIGEVRSMLKFAEVDGVNDGVSSRLHGQAQEEYFVI
jgi:hypothetical protein